MSYESQNILDKKTKYGDVIDFLKLFGYRYQGAFTNKKLDKIKAFTWYDTNDYKSWSGIELWIFSKQNKIFVETRTTDNRSYYDLEHQNKTIRTLKKYFGGTFRTDNGPEKCLRITEKPLEPAASGCYIAFNSFGFNVIRAKQYLRYRNFGGHNSNPSGIHWFDKQNPHLLSNSLILVFLASIHEDYLKSIFIALFKYSNNKERLLKDIRISKERIVRIAENRMSMEQGLAESLSFTNISTACRHFQTLDTKLDFASALKKPYKRRKKNLFDSLEEMITIRNEIVHRASSSVILDDSSIKEAINITKDSTDRCHQELIKIKSWHLHKAWSAGREK